MHEYQTMGVTKMHRKNKASPQNSSEDKKSIIINGDVNNSNIIIGDNSSLHISSSLKQEPEKIPASTPPLVVESDSDTSKLIPFLCYAKENSTSVREFRERLRAESWVDPWFDEEDILPGERWEASVVNAVRHSHAVIIFLSSFAVRKRDFFIKN
jgi:hypothetical protein